MSTKPAKKPAAITITGKTDPLISMITVEAVLATQTTATLKDQLRARSIAIPKTKHEMIRRLAAWAKRPGASFALTLG